MKPNIKLYWEPIFQENGISDIWLRLDNMRTFVIWRDPELGPSDEPPQSLIDWSFGWYVDMTRPTAGAIVLNRIKSIISKTTRQNLETQLMSSIPKVKPDKDGLFFFLVDDDTDLPSVLLWGERGSFEQHKVCMTKDGLWNASDETKWHKISDAVAHELEHADHLSAHERLQLFSRFSDQGQFDPIYALKSVFKEKEDLARSGGMTPSVKADLDQRHVNATALIDISPPLKAVVAASPDLAKALRAGRKIMREPEALNQPAQSL